MRLAAAHTRVQDAQLTTDTIRSTAREVYQEVGGLLQTRAGRLRTVVRGAMSFRSKLLLMRAEQDAKIDGRQVLLG